MGRAALPLAMATLALAVFCGAASPAVPLAAAKSDVFAGTQSPAIAPGATSVQPRTLNGIAALVVVGLLLLLYFYRPRLYIRYWIAGWLLTAASTFLTVLPYAHVRLGWFGYGVSQFIGVAASLVFVLSADAYRSRPQFRRAYLWLALPLFIWFALAPLALGPAAVFAPGHLLIAGALAAAGFAHLALVRSTRMLGAATVGAMLIAGAAMNAWIALSARQPDSPEVAGMAFASLVINMIMALGMQLMTFEDMTYELRSTNRRLETAQSELRQMVTTDALTGCRNRRYFDEIIRREVQRHRRYEIPLSMLFVDIDRFKAINDTLGHEEGDRVLQRVAGFLVRRVREADYVFRWGGDEFLILISCAEPEAERKATELQRAFASSREAKGLPPGVGLSIGCAQITEDATEIGELVKLADERMYLKKRAARV